MSLVRGTSKTRRPRSDWRPLGLDERLVGLRGPVGSSGPVGLGVAEVDQAAAGVGGDRPAGRPRRGRDAHLTVGQGPDRPIRVAVAVTREGHRRVPGRWAGEGVGHWLHALTPVARPRRGRRAGGVRDGLTGPLDAITRPGRARPREAAMSPGPTGAGRKRRMMRGKSALDARKSPPAALDRRRRVALFAPEAHPLIWWTRPRLETVQPIGPVRAGRERGARTKVSRRWRHPVGGAVHRDRANRLNSSSQTGFDRAPGRRDRAPGRPRPRPVARSACLFRAGPPWGRRAPRGWCSPEKRTCPQRHPVHLG